MKRTAILAALLTFVPVAAAAQAPQAAPASAETRTHAVTYLQILFSGLSSENVDQDVKDVLMGCIFNNTMREITEQMDKAIEGNSSVDRSNPTQVLGVMAGVCGYRPPAGAAEAPGADGR